MCGQRSSSGRRIVSSRWGEHRDLIGATEAWDQRLATGAGGETRPVPTDSRRRLIEYLTPVLTDVTAEVPAGDDPETVARRYG